MPELTALERDSESAEIRIDVRIPQEDPVPSMASRRVPLDAFRAMRANLAAGRRMVADERREGGRQAFTVVRMDKPPKGRAGEFYRITVIPADRERDRFTKVERPLGRVDVTVLMGRSWSIAASRAELEEFADRVLEGQFAVNGNPRLEGPFGY